MKIVIPLAGFGTRLRPHTWTKPKPLFYVAGKPFLGHLIEKLSVLNVTEWIFIVGYLGDQIEHYVRDELKLNARFVVQDQMLGQSHAIWLAREHLDDSPTFVVFADTLFETDLTELNRTTADAVIFVKEVEDPRSFGVASLNNDGFITRFVEKPSSMDNRLAVVGLYYFKSGTALLGAIETQMKQGKMLKNEYFIADAMQIMIDAGKKFRTQLISEWLDMGNAEAVLVTNRYLLANGCANTGELHGQNAIIIPPVHVHPTACLENSVIGPNVTIAANCKVTFSVIRDSVLDDHATVRNAVLDNSLVGKNAKVEGRAHAVNIGDTSSVSL